MSTVDFYPLNDSLEQLSPYESHIHPKDGIDVTHIRNIFTIYSKIIKLLFTLWIYVKGKTMNGVYQNVVNHGSIPLKTNNLIEELRFLKHV